MLIRKLPNVGTTIFTQMSALANEHKAINLSQGFPNFDCVPYLKEQVSHYINAGFNQYAPMAGVPELQQAIAHLTKQKYQANIEPNTQITITSGATEALFVAISTLVQPGDEVIIFDPAYDSYEPVIELAGGRTIHIPLLPPHYAIDWNLVEKTINKRTRAIILNNPHNPTGTILSSADIKALQEILNNNNCYLISDEVYEHITFDDQPHLSILRYPELASRAFVISSFGKSFHVTGWKVGYCIAPTMLTEEFRKIHQYVTFSTTTPIQKAIADTLTLCPHLITELGQFFQKKRDLFAQAVKESQLPLLPCSGTYFQLLDYSQLSDLSDIEFSLWLTKEHKIATIPLSPFYESTPNTQIIRVCFAKDEETLIKAASILCQL